MRMCGAAWVVCVATSTQMAIMIGDLIWWVIMSATISVMEHDSNDKPHDK